MKLASTVAIADGDNTKCFTADEFRRVMRISYFVGAVSFWWALERGPNDVLEAIGSGALATRKDAICETAASAITKRALHFVAQWPH